MNILILCTGNSCRSQMAHGFLQSLDPGINVYSAGTRAARQVNRLAVEVMAEAGIDISHHIPTDVSRYRNDPWDYVVTVCSHADRNCRHLPAMSGNACTSALTTRRRPKAPPNISIRSSGACAMK